MARSERREQPVSEGEFESMPEHISDHFDRIRSLLNRDTDGSET